MNITQIFELGDDQLQAHFNIIFPVGIPFGTTGNIIPLRAKGFTIPETKLKTYKVPFHGLEFEKTSTVEESKTFEIEIRMSKSWDVYKDLKQWLDLGYHTGHAGRLPDAVLRTTILIQPLDIQEGGVEVPSRNAIKFNYAKLTGLSGLTFTHESAEVIMMKANFIYVFKEDIPYA